MMARRERREAEYGHSSFHQRTCRRGDNKTNTRECYYDYRNHRKAQKTCPASGKTCSRWWKTNHLAIDWRTTVTTSQSPQGRRDGKNFTDVAETDSVEVLIVHAVNHTVNTVRIEHAPRERLHTRLTANKRTSIVIQIDTGAMCNILNKEDLPPWANRQK